jgi:hypothetical protein
LPGGEFFGEERGEAAEEGGAVAVASVDVELDMCMLRKCEQ